MSSHIPTPEAPYWVREISCWNNPNGYVGVHGPDNKCCYHTNGGPGHEAQCEGVAKRMNMAYAAGRSTANADLVAACQGLLNAIHDSMLHESQAFHAEQIDAARKAIAAARGGVA